MKNRGIFYFFLLLIVLINKTLTGQIIYQHTYGTTTFTNTNPYTVAPGTINANLNTSQWSTSFASGYSSLAGSAGQALSLSNSGGTPTYSLSFNVGSGFNCDITAFSFWRQRSAAGAQNWTLTVNGSTTIGAGTVPTVGISTGTVAAASAANGLSGTVNVVLQLGGATSTGTFRLDDFTLYGSVYPVSGCTTPTLQATSFGTSSIGNNSAQVSWNPGSGGNVIVLARQGSAVSSVPVAGVTYTANAAFGLGQQIGAGNYVVYNGSGAFVNVSALSQATNYYFSVFEYNTTSGSPCYLTPGLTGSLTTTGTSSGLQIRSILVDACNSGPTGPVVSEPYNEMVFFHTGSGTIPISQISIAGRGNTGAFQNNKWPNPAQLWHGLVQNANTASKTAQLNATIQGCGFIREPVGGIIPANSDVIMVTSQYLNTSYNSFTNLNDSIYVVFQDTVSDPVQGHFANYNATPGTRSLAIFDNANSFSDTVVYDVSLLLNHTNGDAVDYDAAGNATYVNRGCQAPYIPLNVDAGVNKNVCFNSSIALTATVNGTYNALVWTGGAGSFSNNSTLTTTYTPGVGETGTIKIYCTVSNNCPPHTTTTKDSVMLTIMQLPQFNLSASNGYSLCPGVNTVMSYSISNPLSAGTVTPSWSSPAGAGATYTIASPGGTTPVTYSVNLTNVCGNTLQTFTVMPLVLPTVTVSAHTPTACSGTTLSLTANGNTGNYSWNNPVSTNSVVVITANTTTTGAVTSTNSCGQTTDSYTLTVTPSSSITVNFSSINLCPGESATITATSSEGTYTWQPGGAQTNTIVTNSTNVYTVSTVGACNTASATVTVTVGTPPTLNISATSPSVCASQTETLSLTGSIGTYSWSTGATTPTITISNPGIYTATVTTSSCGAATASISILARPDPTVTIPISTYTTCPGGTVTIVANSSENNYSWTGSSNTTATLTLVVATSTTGAVTTTNVCGSDISAYSIDIVPNATITVDVNPVNICAGQSATITATSSETTYTWQPGNVQTNTIVVNSANVYTVSSAGACNTASTTVTVTSGAAPTLTISPSSNTLCASGQTATLSLSGSTGTYSWSTGATTSTISISSPGIYSAIVTTAGCGTATATRTITSVSMPTISVSPTSTLLCNGQSAVLTATSNLSNYNWSTGAVNVNTVSVSGANTYTVGVANVCGTATAAVTVSVGSTPSLTLTSSSNTICPNQTATLTVTGGTTPYVWSNSTSTGSVVTTTGGTVSVTYTNMCGTNTKTISIIVSPVSAVISANPQSGIVPLQVNFSNTSVGATSYTWTVGNGNTATTQTINTQTYSDAGQYYATLLVSNGVCTDKDSVLITVLDIEPIFEIPNVFTPNGDSINDIFMVKKYFHIVDLNCTIFDRWGLQLFYWDGITKGWDGTSDGKQVPDGTYFYMINAKDIDGKEIKKQGTVNLFR